MVERPGSSRSSASNSDSDSSALQAVAMPWLSIRVLRDARILRKEKMAKGATLAPAIAACCSHFGAQR
eukprot:1486640-Amphidinium_carterae.1